MIKKKGLVECLMIPEFKPQYCKQTNKKAFTPIKNRRKVNTEKRKRK
jgi:hypothetical protein